MLNSPNRDGDEPGRLSRRVFRQSLLQRFWKLGKTGGTGLRPGSVYSRASYTAYYFGHVPKCNFFVARSIGNLRLAPRGTAIDPLLSSELSRPIVFLASSTSRMEWVSPLPPDLWNHRFSAKLPAKSAWQRS